MQDPENMEDEEELSSLEKKRFLDEVIEHLQKNVPFELPEEHLKRVHEREKEATEQAGSYSHFEDRIREEVIFTKIAAECGLQPTNEELLDYTIGWVSRRAALLGKEPNEKETAAMVERVFSNQQQLNNILSDFELEKVMEFIKDKSTAQNRREISYTDFWKGYNPW